MSEIKDGGPAFPDCHSIDSQGMTLRDYFAAKAMQSAICTDMAHSEGGMLDLARYAYAQADAMLKAREAKP